MKARVCSKTGQGGNGLELQSIVNLRLIKKGGHRRRRNCAIEGLEVTQLGGEKEEEKKESSEGATRRRMETWKRKFALFGFESMQQTRHTKAPD